MSHAIYRQLTPPTGVEFAVSSHFTSETDENLIIAKTSCLEIFRLIPKEHQVPKRKILQLVAIYQASGNIESVNTIRFQGRKTDSLILSFKDAKISIIDYDQASHAVKLISMHYYERAQRSKLASLHYCNEPFVRVDPENRCAAALIYDSSLAVIPFRHHSEDLLEDFSEKLSQEKILPSFIIDLPTLGITHIKDIVFLEEYYQPTILILHEPKQTWAGRLSSLRNSCVLTAISLKLSSKQFPVIWTIEELPYDCISLLSVPKPIGGAIVVCVNGIIYCNQSIRYQLLVNAFTPITSNTPYPIESSKVYLALDVARFCFLNSERMLASLKGGELYFFEIISNGKTVEKIEITKGGSSVIATCICPMSENLIFLGSRLGDSILVHLAEGDIPIVQNNNHSEADSPPQKLLKLVNSDVQADDYDINDMEDDYDYYNSRPVSRLAQKTFSFTVKDSLVNVGPITDIDISESNDLASTSTSETDSRKANIEIVTTTGYAKGGSLSIIQGGIRPQVITSFNLPGCKSIWTVYSHTPSKSSSKRKRDEMENGDQEENSPLDHSLLVLSTEKRTMILDTAEGDLSEISNEPNLSLVTDQRTLQLCNMMGAKRFVQITKLEVRFIAHKYKLLQKLSFTVPIVNSVVLEKTAILFFADLSMELLTVDASGNKLKQTPLKLSRKDDTVTACCLYRDSKIPLFPSDKSDEPRIFAVVGWQSGALEIYKIVDTSLSLCFESNRFARGPQIVTNDVGDGIDSSTQKIGRRRLSLSSSGSALNVPRYVVDVLLFSIGSDLKMPFLVAITDANDLLIYESFHYDGRLRFCRFAHTLSIRPLDLQLISSSNHNHNNNSSSVNAATPNSEDRNNSSNNTSIDHSSSNNISISNQSGDSSSSSDRSSSSSSSSSNNNNNNNNNNNDAMIDDEQHDGEYARKRLFPFVHGNKTGIFLGGLRPAWIICERDYLRIFQMNIDSQVGYYADFNNTKSCPNGFIYLSRNNTLNISRLIPFMNYDAHWPIKKISLRSQHQFYTPHQVVYFRPTKSFIVSTSYRKVVSTISPEEIGGLQKYEESYELRLYSPEQNWNCLDMYPFEESENILCIAYAQLSVKDGDAAAVLKPFILVGTGYLQGENTSCKGRIVIFEIITPTGQDGVMGNPKFKYIYAKVEKGSVSAVASFQGNVVMAIGPKILMYSFESEKDLAGKAFFDAQIYVVSIKTFKNYIVVSDMYKSVVFLIWKRISRQLIALSKDYNQLAVTDTDFVVFNDKLRVVVADQSKNIQFFHYDPKSIDSRAGQMLLPSTDFHLGSQVTKFRHLRMNDLSSTHKSPACSVVFGNVDGSVGIIIPIEEEIYDRLLTLQSMMVSGLPHFAGLNPKAFRKFKPTYKTLRPKCSAILDGELLMKYLSLEVAYQREFARLVGTTPEHILNNLLSIDLSTSFF